MEKLTLKLKGFSKDTKGATAIEYGLIIALMVIGIVAGVSNFSGATTNMYNLITNKISNSTGV